MSLWLCWPGNALATERAQWLYSQLATPPAANTTRQLGYLVQGSLFTAGESYGLGGQLTWDARYFEFSTRFISNQYGNSDSRAPQDTSLSVELARRYLSSDGRFGRLGIEYYWQRPGQAQQLRIGVNTGIFENASTPFVIRVDTGIFLPTTQSSHSRVVFAGLESGYVLKQADHQTWRLGALFQWTYTMRNEHTLGQMANAGVGSIRSEHMLFGIGPWAEFSSRELAIRLSAIGRIWMDKRWTIQGGPSVQDYVLVSYPSAFIDPGIQFSASYLF